MSVASGSILVLNAGSSSIKGAVVPAVGEPAVGQVDLRGDHTQLTLTTPAAGHRVQRLVPQTPDRWQHALDVLLDSLHESERDSSPVAVGHRIVHGGRLFAEPVVVSRDVVKELTALTPLAPLHQPHGLAGIAAISDRYPDLPQVACFDTAFHRTCPEVARRYALPRVWHDRGIERYGFHGLSYQSIVDTLPTFSVTLPQRLVIAHLGAGASMAAVHEGRSIATTMGFTPLDGLVMATRCGSLDPGVVLHLEDTHKLTSAEMETLLSRESGLLGVSGCSGDMQELLASAAPAAAEAVELFCYHAVRAVGSLAAALGGLDAVVFTAGIGEHAAVVRERICDRLRWLGLVLDAQANASHGPLLSTPESRVSCWVIPTNEAAVIARGTRRALSAAA